MIFWMLCVSSMCWCRSRVCKIQHVGIFYSLPDYLRKSLSRVCTCACRCSGLVHTFECVSISEQSSLGQRGVIKHTLIVLMKLHCCHIQSVIYYRKGFLIISSSFSNMRKCEIVEMFEQLSVGVRCLIRI